MAGGVDGFDAGQAEVPEQVGLGERRQEGAAGAVDVDGDVQAGFGLELVEGEADGVDWFKLEGEGDAERDDDSDGVFVAAFEDFFGGEEQSVAFHGDFADFDVEVAAELVPADLDGAHDEIRRFDGLAGGALTLAPVPLEGEAAEHGGFAGAGSGAADGGGSFG